MRLFRLAYDFLAFITCCSQLPGKYLANIFQLVTIDCR